MCYQYGKVSTCVASTNHVWHASDSGPFELIGEGWQAVGKSSLVLELLLRVKLLARPCGTLTIGLGPKWTSIGAQAHLERKTDFKKKVSSIRFTD